MVRAAVFQILAVAGSLAAAVPAASAPDPAAAATSEIDPALVAELTRLQEAFQQAFARSDWAAAAKALQASLAIQEKALGPEHPIALTTLDTLAIAFQLDERFPEAEALFRRELEARRRSEGERSPQLPRILTSIAFTLGQQNKFAESETFYRDALERQIALTGEKSAETAEALGAHASSLAKLGRSQDALADATRARDILVALHGPQSVEAADGYDSLGKLLNNLGRYAEAEAQHRRALAIRTAAGDQALETIASQNNLGISLIQLGRFGEAEALLRKALASQRAISDGPSPLTANVLSNLATAIQNGGNPAGAEPLQREALAMLMATSGPEHPLTLTATTNLATSLSALGRYTEAERLARQAFDGRLKIHGENHPETSIAATNLAAQLSSLGRDVEAELLYRRALAIMQATNGEEHPDTASAYSNLAFGLAQQGRFAEAAELDRRSLAIRRKVLGNDHPDTAENLGNLGYVLARQEDYAGADPLFREALELLRQHFGDDSLAAARAYNNLASNLNDMGQDEEAAPLYLRSLEIRRKLLGPDHPQTLISLNNVAYSRYGRGDLKGSGELYRQVVAAERRVFAPANPARIIALNNLAFVLAEQGDASAEGLQLARESTGIASRRRAAILAGSAAGEDNAAQARIRARSGETLRSDPYVTSFITLMQVDWLAAARNAAQLPELRAEAFKAAQEIDVSSAALAMARTAARTAAGGGPLGDLVNRQQSLSEQVAALEKAYSAATAGPDRQRINAEIETVSAQLAAVDGAIDRQFPDYRNLISPAALDVAEVQKRLRPGEGLLLIVPSSGDMFSFAVTSDTIAWNRAPKRQIPMKKEVAGLVCQIDPQTCPADAASRPLTPFEQQGYAAFDRAAAYALYRDMIAPVEGALSGVRSLYVTTTGTLATLPLGLLVTRPPGPGDDADPDLLGRTPWLADRYAITVLPAVSSLRTFDRLASSAKGGFVGYGAPSLGERPAAAEAARAVGVGARSPGGAARGGLADQALLRTMSPLPGTLVELKAMAEALGSPPDRLRLGQRDTELSVKRDGELANARVIAFATHGLLPRELGAYAEPGLVFTPPAEPSAVDDGVLAASEAAELRIKADWVVLSACNTAGAESGAESLSGLARSFLYAGANSLLASYWRVSDDATAVLTVETLKADENLTRAEALQAAMRAVRTGRRADGSAVSGWTASWSHPAAWAPFSLIANRNE